MKGFALDFKNCWHKTKLKDTQVGFLSSLKASKTVVNVLLGFSKCISSHSQLAGQPAVLSPCHHRPVVPLKVYPLCHSVTFYPSLLLFPLPSLTKR